MSEVVGPKTVRVSVEVRSGTARFQVGVQARSIRDALGVVGARYPQDKVSVVFPIEPEGFFVEEPGARARMIGAEQARRKAA